MLATIAPTSLAIQCSSKGPPTERATQRSHLSPQDSMCHLWRDSAHDNRKRLMTLRVDEFLRRFLLHLLPRSFVRIRNFGFLTNRKRANLLPLCAQLLATQVRSAIAA